MHRSVDIYQIKVQGHFQNRLSTQFSGFSFEYEENGVTTLTGPIIDQAALRGIVDLFFDLGIAVLSIHRFEPQY